MAWSTPDHIIINTNIHESDFLQQIPTSHCTYLYKRAFINANNIRYKTDLLVGLDLITLATALIHASKVSLVPHTVYYYHQTEKSAIRGNLSAAIVKDAIRSKSIVAELLNAAGLHDAANMRLKRWEYIIDTFMQRMPNYLTYDECIEAFDDFRDLINSNHVVPWESNTPCQYRYTLALVLAQKDKEALSFLSNRDSFVDISGKAAKIKYLKLILEHVPHDICSLMDLGRLLRAKGDLEHALVIFETVIRYEPDNYDAQLQATGSLIQLERYEEARENIDALLDSVTCKLDSSNAIKGAATLKEHLGRNEFSKRLKSTYSAEMNAAKSAHRAELKAVREELISMNLELCKARSELEDVYASRSWRITAPLRNFMGKIKNIL
jgi:tetratricopeptide (TPR) repeat protein